MTSIIPGNNVQSIQWREFAAALATSERDVAIRSIMNLGTDQFYSFAEPAEDGRPYGRRAVLADEGLEIMVACWQPHAHCAPHNHGMADGEVLILDGEFEETSFELNHGALCAAGYNRYKTGDVCRAKKNDIHAMKSLRERGLTLHIYRPQISDMEVYDIERSEILKTRPSTGAWLPLRPEDVAATTLFGSLPVRCCLVLYTTKYRLGGDKFKRAAEKHAADSKFSVTLLKAVESKADFVEAIRAVEKMGYLIEELNFFGHSGVYGIMFGTTKWPEQFSPFEWKNFRIPFTTDARAYFHACRTAIWFAPFFAKQFRIKAFGHQLYTTVSADKRVFRWEGLGKDHDKDIYIISCRGKKSHGLSGSLYKYSGSETAIAMTCFDGVELSVDRSYDKVAELYQNTFDDISVRADEIRWIDQNLEMSRDKVVLDIGCGNGALLRRCSSKIGKGIGVDSSKGMIEVATANSKEFPNLSFVKIDGPILPFPDNYFDEIVSMLSFRYLDWDPIVEEMLRVIKPGGHINVLDMVTAPVQTLELPKLVSSKLKHYVGLWKKPSYRLALNQMVSDKAWATMVKHNPIRSQHEFKWFLESRFSGAKTSLINVGWSSRILAFRSLPISDKTAKKLTYP